MKPSSYRVLKAGDSRNLGSTFPTMDKDAAIIEVIRLLSDSLSPRVVAQWFGNDNRYLHGSRPVDLLNAGQHELVIEAARALIEGTYL